MSRLRNFAFLLFLFISSYITHGQGICNDPRYAHGGFILSNSEVCTNDTVVISNSGDVNNAKYLLNYNGESYEEVMIKGSDRIDLSSIKKTKIYTIIQVGEKDGKETVHCEQLSVRVGNSPVFSYNYCFSPTELDVSIPVHPLNNHDSYAIEINGNVSTVYAADLPFRAKFPIAAPAASTLQITGNGGVSGCNFAAPAIEIPRFGSSVNRNYDYFPQINHLRVLDNKTVELDFKGMYGEAYNIYKYPAGTTNTGLVPYRTNIPPGKFTDPTPSNNSYCYFIQAPNPICGIVRLRSSDVCSIILDEAAPPTTNQIDIKWTLVQSPNSYPAYMPSGITKKEIKLHKITENAATAIVVGPAATTYSDSPIDCSKKYCYTVSEINEGHINAANFRTTSYSNQLCFDYKINNLPPLSPLYVSTENDKNVIRFEDFTSNPYPTHSYLLYKFDGANFNLVDSIPAPNTNLMYEDFLGVPSQSERYSVQYKDICKNVSPLSDPVNSIFLSENGNNLLEWTGDSPFDMPHINYYEILYYADSTTTIPIYREKVLPSQLTHVIETSLFSERGSFRILAVNNLGVTAYSNIISVSVKGVLFLPNVFTPNGDSNNDTFEIKGSIGKVSAIKIQIYSSLNHLVFESDNTDTQWDGLYPDGQKANQGTYYYKLSAKMSNDQFINKEGSFLLLR